MKAIGPIAIVGLAGVFAVTFAMLGLLTAAGFASVGTDSGGTQSTVAGGGSCKLSKDQAYKEIDSNTKEPPPVLIPVYQGAAAKFKLGPKGPSILAGIHKQETNFSRSTLPGVRSGENGSQAGGPMQFIPGTWAGYQMDGNGDGKKDRYDPVDAIFAAAKLMKANGAPGDWHGALARYYGADVDGYVDSVLQHAQGFNLPGPVPCP